jgi:hypothetical protein
MFELPGSQAAIQRVFRAFDRCPSSLPCNHSNITDELRVTETLGLEHGKIDVSARIFELMYRPVLRIFDVSSPHISYKAAHGVSMLSALVVQLSYLAVRDKMIVAAVFGK